MENKNEKVNAREYYLKLDVKPYFTQLTKTGISDNLHNVFRFANEYHRDQSKVQATYQKETIDRLMDILQKTTETLMAVRRHGIREEEGYETVVTLVGETIHESEQLLKETEQ